jgi:tetratricopeptide (TPR) repeat protein
MLADETEDLTKFKGSSWWLARGWTPAQFAKMIVQFPRKEFIISKGFDLHKQWRLSLIEESTDDREKSRYKNSFAWFLAICGEDLETAEKHVQDAIEIRKRHLDERASANDGERSRTAIALAAALDTWAYILMQMHKLDEAEIHLREAVNLGETHGLNGAAESETYYKYWIVLSAQGKKESALGMDKKVRSSGYTPTHELLLLRGLEFGTSQN